MSNQSGPEHRRQDRVSVDANPTRAHVFLCHQHTGPGRGGPFVPALAKLDSGTEDEWVSSRLLERFKDVEYISLEYPETYKAFQNSIFTARKCVQFTWYSENSPITRTGFFRVMEDGPFDVIIGSKLLFDDGIYSINRTALLFVHLPAKVGEKERMQQTLASQTAEVMQYSAEQSLANTSARRRQREALETERHSGIDENLAKDFPSPGPKTMSRPPQHARSCSFPGLQAKSGCQQLDRGAANFRQPETYSSAFPRPEINGTAYTRFLTEATPISIEYWREKIHTVEPDSGERRTSLADARRKPCFTQEQTLRPIYSGSRGGHWQCSKCKQKNDPLRDPERCGACAWLRQGRSYRLSVWL